MDRWLEQKKDHPVNDFCVEERIFATTLFPIFLLYINPRPDINRTIYIQPWKYKIRTKRGRELIFPEEWRAFKRSSHIFLSFSFFFSFRAELLTDSNR